MPFFYKKRTERKEYDEKLLQEAVEEVLQGACKLREAARKYGIPKSTLENYKQRAAQGIPLNNYIFTQFSNKFSTNQVFTVKEEASLVNYIITCSKLQYGFGKNKIRAFAFEYAKANNKKVPKSWTESQKAGLDWLRGFLKRNPSLALRSPEATSLVRNMAFNRHNVSNFFSNLLSLMTKYNFSPERIYNIDENGITTVQKPTKILAQKGMKQVGQVTMCGAINAVGQSLPPFFIFPRVHFKPNLMLKNAPVGSSGTANPSGWMTAEIFVEYLRHFLKFTKCTTDSPSLIILDNHRSHISLEALNFARENGIYLLTLPPHCSNRLQPLDISVFGPFKRYYNAAVDSWLTNNPGRVVTIYEVAEIVSTAFSLAFTINNILTGFRKTGIYPLNQDIFTDEDVMCSEVINQPDPNSSTSSSTFSGPEPSQLNAQAASSSDDDSLRRTLSPQEENMIKMKNLNCEDINIKEEIFVEVINIKAETNYKDINNEEANYKHENNHKVTDSEENENYGDIELMGKKSIRKEFELQKKNEMKIENFNVEEIDIKEEDFIEYIDVKVEDHNYEDTGIEEGYYEPDNIPKVTNYTGNELRIQYDETDETSFTEQANTKYEALSFIEKDYEVNEIKAEETFIKGSEVQRTNSQDTLNESNTIEDSILKYKEGNNSLKKNCKRELHTLDMMIDVNDATDTQRNSSSSESSNSESISVKNCKHSKLYECSECNHNTIKKLQFIHHIKNHESEKSLKFSECNYNTVIKMSQDSDKRCQQDVECDFRSQNSNKRCQKDVECDFRSQNGNKRCQQDVECDVRSQNGNKRCQDGVDCDFKSQDGNKRCQQAIKCDLRTKLNSNKRCQDQIEKLFKCIECGFSTRLKAYLKRHLRIHTGAKLFKCDECDYQAANKSTLKYHEKIHTGEKLFKCNYCDYSASQMAYLKRHEMIHTGDKPFKCSHCDYKSRDKSTLQIHIRTHTGEKPFKCSECDYCASQMVYLKRHIMMHTGEKPFKCSHCDYKTNDRSILRSHIRIHTGEKPFKCIHCDYRAPIKSALRSHIRIHTGEKPFNCSYCDYSASLKGNLKKHVKIHSGEKSFKGSC